MTLFGAVAVQQQVMLPPMCIALAKSMGRDVPLTGSAAEGAMCASALWPNASLVPIAASGAPGAVLPVSVSTVRSKAPIPKTPAITTKHY
jgi:hypothetical protein